jgi:class 3 adenylate cyclase/tetratricopeptide (TPR) repeat protein
LIVLVLQDQLRKRSARIVESAAVYIPMDRRQALANGVELPEKMEGAALFADISGFTPLTEALAQNLGPQRGAEELTRSLNQVYDAVVGELHRFGGSAIGFSGDAMTCWFSGRRAALQAAACGLAMQEVMRAFAALPVPSGGSISLALKVAVAAGRVRRFLVGDPQIQKIEVIAGSTLDRLAEAEHHAQKGELVLDPKAAEALTGMATFEPIPMGEATVKCARLIELQAPVNPAPWPDLPPHCLSEDQARPWLLPTVFQRISQGLGVFLAELRPAVALFLRFTGIHYDSDSHAGTKLDRFIRDVQAVLARYDGNLIQLTIGDKGSYLFAAFGAPVAHEDDIQRAASAALELRELGKHFDFLAPLQIGLSSGFMRTGAYGGSMQRTYGVIGDSTNLAARLMQAAAPGQILAARRVYYAAARGFEWREVGEIALKGKSRPIAVRELVRINHGAYRHHDQLYSFPIVGRRKELDLLREKCILARKGHGQIVAISAEAGMGKSRLLAESLRQAEARRFVRFSGECLSYGANTAYHVWERIWRDFFAVDAGWPPEEVSWHLQTLLSKVSADLPSRAPLLGAVLHIPLPENELTLSLDAKVRKSSLEALLVDCVRARASQSPLLIVLEDCHWIDPLSRDLLDAISRAVANLPVIILLTYRPPERERVNEPIFQRLPHFLEIALSEFSPAEAAQLIHLKLQQLFGQTVQVPHEFVQRVVDRSEGNPFYIEELISYLYDRGVSLNDHEALERLEFPTSLHSLVLSRIDQIQDNQKTALKVASVIGRLFEAAMLWGVYPDLGPAPRVKADLEAISRAELIVQEAPEPKLAYLFKHVITQEVAYESLPFATRSLLHEQIGGYIERLGAGAGSYLDLLAYHYGRSENLSKKREYLLRAGDAARAAYSNSAALDYYQRLLPFLPAEEQPTVLLKLGQVLELVGRWPQADETYRYALELAEGGGDLSATGRCQAALGELHRKQGQYDQAMMWLERARKSFDLAGDRAGVGQAWHYSGSVAAQRGDYAAAQSFYEQSLSIRRELGDRKNTASLLSNLGIVARYQGRLNFAHRLHEEALSIRRELGDRWAIANSLNNLGNLVVDEGNLEEARPILEEALRLHREVGDPWSVANSANNLANLAREQRDYQTARALYRESLLINRELGDRWSLAYLLEDVGGLAILEGDCARALRLIAAAEVLRDAAHAPLSPAEKDKLDHLLGQAVRLLGEKASQTALKSGRRLALDQAIDQALAGLAD